MKIKPQLIDALSSRREVSVKNRKTPVLFLWIFLILGIALPAKPASAELMAKLPKVMNPFFMTIADGRLYIVEDSVTVHLYRLGAKDVSFVTTFAREGQGPGEFDFIHQLRVRDDHLDIPGRNKLARFSLEGEYLDEIKLPIDVFKGGLYRLGENFLARSVQFDAAAITTTIRLYDKNFKLIKEVGSRKDPLGVFEKQNLVPEYYSARVAGDQIYVIDSGRESIVTVYDRNGARQKVVRLPLEPAKMTAALKEAILKPFKEDPEMTSRWDAFEKRLYFPDYAPGLDYFEVVDGKFVTRTYTYRENLAEFAVFDPEGRELQRVFLPNTGRLSYGILFCFFQGRFFCLRYNFAEDVWELHSEKVW